LLEEESVSSMYSRLFKLPRLRMILVISVFFSMLLDILLVSAFSSFLIVAVSQFTILGVLFLGFLFLQGSYLVSSGLSNLVFLRGVSKVMNSRRTLGVSLFSLIFTTSVFAVGWVLYSAFSVSFLVEFLVFALAVGFVVRLLVDLVMLEGHVARSIGDSLSQPMLNSCLLLCLLGVSWFLSFVVRLFVVICIFSISATLYVSVVGSQLRKFTGVDGRAFFSSFLSEWGAGVGDELEKIIDRNSVKKDLKATTLSFRNRDGETKVILVVPSIHPGPFKGVGSSNLPAYLMRKLENDFGCPVICAHGPSTHGENLVRSSQSEDIYRQISKVLGECVRYDLSSPLVKVASAGITVACQIFGDFALLIGGSSPSFPIDDVSLDVGEDAINAAKKYAKQASFIDSHSCIDPASDYVWRGSKISEAYVKVSQKAAEQASKLKEVTFKIGAAKIRSTGISKVEGMGEEGASAIVMQIGGRKIAYVFFDSNNLTANIKDPIVKELTKMGYDEVEVLTSDTHSTSALSPGKMGYNPLGYSTPSATILQIVISVVNLAERNLEEASVCVGIQILKDVKVAGEENMQNILLGTRNSLKVAKKLAPVAFGSATVLSVLTLLFI